MSVAASPAIPRSQSSFVHLLDFVLNAIARDAGGRGEKLLSMLRFYDISMEKMCFCLWMYRRPGTDPAILERQARAKVAKEQIRTAQRWCESALRFADANEAFRLSMPHQFQMESVETRFSIATPLETLLRDQVKKVDEQVQRLEKLADTDRFGRGAKYHWLVVLQEYVRLRTAGRWDLQPADLALLVESTLSAVGAHSRINVIDPNTLGKTLRNFRLRNPLFIEAAIQGARDLDALPDDTLKLRIARARA